MKSRAEYVPYDLQKGVKLDTARKSDMDEDDNFALQR